MISLAVAFAVAALTDQNLAGVSGIASDDPAAVAQQPAPWRHWSRGQILPPAYRTSPISDYTRHHLRQPPQGYQWYQCGDQMVLAADDSGMIFEVIDGD